MDEPGPQRSPGAVLLGRVSGVYGVRGWVKVFSYTDPKENVLSYRVWWLGKGGDRRRFRVVDGRLQGKTVVASLESLTDRDAATEWIGADISVERGDLPEPGEGTYYWADLIGLTVHDSCGIRIGRVSQMLETGTHDVMVVERGARDDVLIPFVPDVTVKAVRLDDDEIVVDWEWV